MKILMVSTSFFPDFGREVVQTTYLVVIKYRE